MSRNSDRTYTKKPSRTACQQIPTEKLKRMAHNQVFGKRRQRQLPHPKLAVAAQPTGLRRFRVTNSNTNKAIEVNALSWNEALAEALSTSLARSVKPLILELHESDEPGDEWTKVWDGSHPNAANEWADATSTA